MAGATVWVPSANYSERTRVRLFMERHGIVDLQELVRRSRADVEWFWQAVVEDLPIEFYTPYEAVLDVSRGPSHARWFVGGTINVAHNCLDRHARSSRRDRPALIWEGEDGATRTLSYGDLLSETNGFAGALKRLGVGRGDRVGIFLPMAPEAVVALLACAKIGAIATPIFSGFGAPAVAARLNDCAAKVLITADGTFRRGHVVPLKDVADEAVALSPCVRHVIVWRRAGCDVRWTSPRDVWWHEVVAGEPADCATEPMESEDPFLLAYTSGTTGKPKGAVHVHGGLLVKIAQEAAHQVDMGPDDTLFWVTDLGWIMGPWEVVGGLAHGGTVVLYEGAPDYPSPDRLWYLVERHRPTILGVSPTLIRALMRYGVEPVSRHDLTSLRVLGSTGEPWNPGPWQWYFDHVGQGRCPIINFSGGTEVGACFLSPLPIQPLKPCSLGGPALGMAVDVYDATGKPLRGGVGELVCTKPWPGMTRGLWNDEERYQQTYWSRWPGVWVHGDWASIDADGEWFLYGRSDDTLNVAGKRIGPAEIESAAVGHPAVAEAAAVGVPHEVKGESIWCFIVLRPGFEPGEPLAKAVRSVISDNLGKSFAPEQIRFVRDLPRTRSAKIVRRAIRAKLLGEDPGDLTGLENAQALDEITSVP
ncbi:MAG: acetate--CoA ligase [Isosphaeraceae bacterium]|nr:acetate--CoA ligase [Isosphaeraceae bacterium]